MKAVANWRNASEYPKWDTTSLTRFAWEFLRRNPKYQADWEEYLTVCRRLVPSFDPHVAHDWDEELYEHDNRFHYDPRADYFRYDPPRQQGESYAAWVARVGRGKKISLHNWYAKKWGLMHNFPDPFHAYEKYELGMLAINFAESAATKTEIASRHWEYFNENKYPFNREPKQALVIDYSLPIDMQLNTAKEYLIEHQQILIRDGIVDEFPTKIPRKELVVYLRVLDATADNFDANAIAEQIYPHEDNLAPDYPTTKKVRAAMKVAEKWRDIWFRFLPSMKK
jgi:hypothetical protein